MHQRRHLTLGLFSALLVMGAGCITSPVEAASTVPPTTTINGQTWVAVSTVGELEYIDQHASSYLDAHIALEANIDVTGFAWQPIGDAASPFIGTLNGQHFTLTGAFASCPPTPHFRCGLFGVIQGGTVENLNADVSGTPAANLATVGGIAGTLQGAGLIQQVTVSGAFGGNGGYSIGGIVGDLAGTSVIRAAANTASVSGNGGGDTGGLVGQMGGTSAIDDSANTGAVSGTYAGGIAGRVGAFPLTPTTVTNVYSTGSVTGQYAGGLFSVFYDSTVTGAYTSGTVTGSVQGGDVATSASGTFVNVYDRAPSALADVYGQSTTSGITAVTTPTLAMFPGLNFTSVWGLSASVNSGWPYLIGVGPNPPPPVPVWTPPLLTPETVTVGATTTEVIGNFGYNPVMAIQSSGFMGYVEERAAIEAGASFSGEGTDSSYLSAILDGAGVGMGQSVTANQQGQFAALYQKLGIIPVWTDNTVSIPAGVATLRKAGASTLAIENYLVELDGFSWAAAETQAAAGFPMQSAT